MSPTASDLSRIGALLAIAIVITVGYSYLPAEMSSLKTALSVFQLAVMALIMTIAVRSVLREF